jgi:hypothetical protein
MNKSGISNYFVLSPEDIITQILVNLDFIDLLNIIEVYNLELLNKKRFWIDKYNFDFGNIDWGLFTTITGNYFSEFYINYMNFTAKYSSTKDILDGLMVDGHVVEANVQIVNIYRSKIIDLLTIGGKKRISDQLRKDLDLNGEPDKVAATSITYDRKKKQFYIDFYMRGYTRKLVKVTYNQAFEIFMYAQTLVTIRNY